MTDSVEIELTIRIKIFIKSRCRASTWKARIHSAWNSGA